MTVTRVSKNHAAYVRIFAMLLAAGLFFITFPESARADTLTYSFSGTLNTAWNGNNTVTGLFTLDTTNETITAFSFATPVANITPSTNWAATVTTLTPALNPSADFVHIYFETPLHDTFMNLVFETELSTFSGSTFFVGQVTPYPAAILESVIQCAPGEPFCSDPGYHSTFTSGSATLVATPEPSSLLMMLVAGLFVLVRLIPRRYC